MTTPHDRLSLTLGDSTPLVPGAFYAGTNRNRVPLELGATRELDSGDIAALSTAPAAPAQTLKRLRGSHHKLAQLLSLGCPTAMAAIQTGYSPERISMLQRDPAFKQLLGYYEELGKVAFANITERLADVTLDALEVLQERIDENPEAISTRDLLEILKATADRSGNGPTSKSHTINEHRILDAGKLAEIKAKAKEDTSTNVRTLTHETHQTIGGVILEQTGETNPAPSTVEVKGSQGEGTEL